jgi:hypothetical protein
MSIFQWPFKRKTYPGIENPRFVSDIEASNESTLDGLAALAGLGTTDFAIISGLNFTAGVPNTFTPGVFFLNGVFYYMGTVFNENLFLQGNMVDTLSEAFTDGNSRYIYTLQQGAAVAVSSPSTTPAFTGNMNTYRINNAFIAARVNTLMGITNSLGTAAFANIGTAAGNVPDAGNVYTKAQSDTLLGLKGPSIVGSIVEIWDPSGAFLSNFDGTGLGIVFPWYVSATGERWGLANGNNGLPNMAGVSTVGVGTFTNPDSSTRTFVNNVQQGETDHLLITTEIPAHTHTVDASDNGTSNGSMVKPGWSDNETSAQGTFNTRSAGGGGKHNNMPPVLPVFKAIRIS